MDFVKTSIFPTWTLTNRVTVVVRVEDESVDVRAVCR